MHVDLQKHAVKTHQPLGTVALKTLLKHGRSKIFLLANFIEENVIDTTRNKRFVTYGENNNSITTILQYNSNRIVFLLRIVIELLLTCQNITGLDHLAN